MILSPVAWERIVRWRESGVSRTLTCSWRNEPQRGRLSMRLAGASDEGISETTRSGKWWQVAYALPIRVRGEAGPQVLVRLSRPNWMDYALYRVVGDGFRRDFGISVRDPRSIRWESHGGALAAFTLYDRWRAAPPRLRDHEPRGKRWEWVTHWTFSPRRGWAHGKGHWSTYRFGTPPAGQDFGVGSCPFTCPGGS